VKKWMDDLAATGRYEVDDDVKAALHELFWAGYCDDEGTKTTIRDTFDDYNYLCDTHTAVGLNVYNQYVAATDDSETPVIVASTANPYKFAPSVLGALTDVDPARSEFDIIDELSVMSSADIPDQLDELRSKEVRFDRVCDREKMVDTVREILGLK